MSEGGVSACPQVFVVDSQASYIKMPCEKKSRWARESHKFLFLLVGLSLLGVFIEGRFIYTLYQKTEELSSCRSHHLCHNLSSPTAPVQQDVALMHRAGSEESNEIPLLRTKTKQRPFAHLLGSHHPVDENNVVLWVEEGEAITRNMTYENGRLMVEQDGYYYIYSKVQINAAEDCKLIQLKVMKETSAYGHPIDLMKSKSYRCWTPKPLNGRGAGREYLWSSFLAGIYHLQRGDKIFVTLDKTLDLRPGPTENFMGAFMISP